MARHHEDGCDGDGTPCTCALTQDGALESAIADARRNPWAIDRTRENVAS
jgi:hypothetical protein